VEHTKIHPALKGGTKNFHNTSNLAGFLGNKNFHETKIPKVDMKVQVWTKFSKKIVEKSEISTLHEFLKN
jgi:aldehyde:ferredoxin oxidoreductase